MSKDIILEEIEIEEKNGITIGDTIKWSGSYVNGYDEGINKVVKVFYETSDELELTNHITMEIIWMRLDNDKLQMITNGMDDYKPRWEKL